jgi:hypothetical protein
MSQDTINNLIERIDVARGELQNGFRRCQEILASRFSVSDSTDWVFVESARSQAMSDIFLAMGEFAGKALKAFSFGETDGNPEWEGLLPNSMEYYFWPGYDHLDDAQPNKRSTLRCKVSDGSSIPCGYGASVAKSELRMEEPVATSLWYDAVLAQHQSTLEMPTQPIPPGSTHRWVTELSLNKELPHYASDNPKHFTYLEIGFGCDCIPRTGCMSVNLSRAPDSLKKWPEFISNDLSAQLPPTLTEYLKEKYQWPMSADAIRQNKSVRFIQKRCYAIWLAVTLGIPLSGHNRDFADTFDRLVNRTARLLRMIEVKERCSYSLSDLIARIDVAAKIKLASHNTTPFRHWYSLPVDPTLDDHYKPNSLGSFMLLTTHPIARPIIYMFSSWVHKVYSEIRLVESAAIVTRETKSGKNQQFAHLIQGQVKTLVNALEYCINERWKANGLRVTRQQQFAVHMYGHTSRSVPRLQVPKQVDWKTCVLDAAFHAIRRLSDRCKSTGSKPLDAALLASLNERDVEALLVSLRDSHAVGLLELLKNIDPALLAILKSDDAGKDRQRKALADLLDLAMKRSVGLKEEWSDVSEDHLTKFAEDIGGNTILNATPIATMWDNDLFEGLLTYALTQAFFHGAVFSRSIHAVRELVPRIAFNKSPTFARVQVTNSSNGSFEVRIYNRAFVDAAKFDVSTDYRTLQVFQSRFDQAEPGRISFQIDKCGRKQRWFKTVFRVHESDVEFS